ncbi:phosphatidylglycerophosphatase A [Bacteriovoracaceae bacterium]|nr:phosphatidylglycerophosphatase A [Bacteriovoracaceae bacterium]
MNRGTLVQIVVTWFGLGKIPFMPGTWGSLGAIPILGAIHLIFDTDTMWGQWMWILTLISIIIVLYLVGFYCTRSYLKTGVKSDPQEVVIDEVVGQLLSALIFMSLFWGFARGPGVWQVEMMKVGGEIPYLCLCFALFRFYDIVKVWPVSYADTKLPGAHGVMMDDVFAGLYAGITLFGIEFGMRFYQGH